MIKRFAGRSYEFLPGQVVPKSGRYRCTTCQHIQTFAQGEKFKSCSICKDHIRTWCRVEDNKKKK